MASRSVVALRSVAALPVTETDPAALLESVADAEPGPALMAILCRIDSAKLDQWGAIELARQWQRHESWVAAQLQSALSTVMTAPAEYPVKPERVMDELAWRHDLIAAALRWSTVTSGSRVGLAQALATTLSETRTLLESGAITLRHATVLHGALDNLDPETIAAVQARVLPRAPLQTVAEFGRSVRRAVLAANPETAQVRHAKAAAERDVRRIAQPDGMASLIVTMPAADIDTIYLALDAVARKAASAAGPDEPPLGLDAWRADVLLSWATGALADPQLPTRQGRRVETQIVIDLPTCSGWPTIRRSSPATARSPQRRPASWPPMRTGADSSSTRSAVTCSTSGRRSTGRRKAWPTTCVRATGDVDSPAVRYEQSRATSTTLSPPAPTGRPPHATAGRCVVGITWSRPTAAGSSTPTSTAPACGPRRPATRSMSTPKTNSTAPASSNRYQPPPPGNRA